MSRFGSLNFSKYFGPWWGCCLPMGALAMKRVCKEMIAKPISTWIMVKEYTENKGK